MFNDGTPNSWGAQSDPFAEDFFLVPHEEETRARARHVLNDNRDAVRHHVELLTWEMQDSPDLLKAFISLLWHWEKIDPKWIAEAAFMSVGDVSQLAEAQPLMIFPCLDCGTLLYVKNRRHLLQLHHSSELFYKGTGEYHHLTNLLCRLCNEQRAINDEEQRELDKLRQEALLAEYRKRPYAERRKTKEWAILKKQIHRRDGYRCRLCGDDDAQLHVHHNTYENYGEERLEDLITLCGSCHRNFHYRQEVS